MQPVAFEGVNRVYGPPAGMSESQVAPIPAHVHEIAGGSNDGTPVITVAWLPSDLERAQISMGAPIFVSMFCGLLPHCLTTSLEQAKAVH